MQKHMCSHATLGGSGTCTCIPYCHVGSTNCTRTGHASRSSWVLVNTGMSPKLSLYVIFGMCQRWWFAIFDMWFAITDLCSSSLGEEYLARRKPEIKTWAWFNIHKGTNTLWNADHQTYQFKLDLSYTIDLFLIFHRVDEIGPYICKRLFIVSKTGFSSIPRDQVQMHLYSAVNFWFWSYLFLIHSEFEVWRTDISRIKNIEMCHRSISFIL